MNDPSGGEKGPEGQSKREFSGRLNLLFIVSQVNPSAFKLSFDSIILERFVFLPAKRIKSPSHPPIPRLTSTEIWVRLPLGDASRELRSAY